MSETKRLLEEQEALVQAVLDRLDDMGEYYRLVTLWDDSRRMDRSSARRSWLVGDPLSDLPCLRGREVVNVCYDQQGAAYPGRVHTRWHDHEQHGDPDHQRGRDGVPGTLGPDHRVGADQGA